MHLRNRLTYRPSHSSEQAATPLRNIEDAEKIISLAIGILAHFHNENGCSLKGEAALRFNDKRHREEFYQAVDDFGALVASMQKDWQEVLLSECKKPMPQARASLQKLISSTTWEQKVSAMLGKAEYMEALLRPPAVESVALGWLVKITDFSDTVCRFLGKHFEEKYAYR